MESIIKNEQHAIELFKQHKPNWEADEYEANVVDFFFWLSNLYDAGKIFECQIYYIWDEPKHQKAVQESVRKSKYNLK